MGSSRVTEPESSTDVLAQSKRVEVEDPSLFGTLPEGSDVGQYVLERSIGGGGCGVVYAARHHTLRQRVAIKVLRGELTIVPITVTRFLREVDAVMRIDHPNIVRIFDFGEVSPGRPYYVMELLEGVDLREHLAAHGRFSAQEALELLSPVCEAVAAAHAAHIVHRDIKANNVMVAQVDGQRVVKLLDFGIAKIMQTESSGPGLTEPGARIGTARNMAPEQIRGEPVDARADIYALGVLLYQLLTGDYPFHGDHPQKLALQHLTAPPPRPSASAPVSAEIDAVVLRCLEKKREDRFQTVEALLEAFRAAVGSAPEGGPAVRFSASALHLEVALDGEADEDAVMDDLIEVLDTVEHALAARNYHFPLRSSNALLAVKRLSEPAAPSLALEEVRALAAELGAELATRPSAQPGVTPVLAATVGEIDARETPEGDAYLGGPLLDLESWTTGARVTPGAS